MTSEEGILLRDYYYYTDPESYYYKPEFKQSMNRILMSGWKYTPRTIVHTNGDKTYRAEFQLKRPANCFSFESWKFNSGGSEVIFYCNDVKVFSEYSSREPIFNTQNGITRVVIITDTLHVYDMYGNIIKSNITIGPDNFVDFIQVSPHYAIGMTEETCTYDPSGSIWNLDTLMFDEEDVTIKYYSNHRTPIPLAGQCDCNNTRRFKQSESSDIQKHYYHPRYIPIIATINGFVVWDTVDRKKYDKIISYEDTYMNNFDFDPEYVDPITTLSEMSGRSVEDLEQEMREKNGTLSFVFSHNDGPN